MNKLVSDKDVKALEAYLCLKRRPDTYEWQRDLYDLMHWLDITSDSFALRLKEAYPQLTMQELLLSATHGLLVGRNRGYNESEG